MLKSPQAVSPTSEVTDRSWIGGVEEDHDGRRDEKDNQQMQEDKDDIENMDESM